MKKVILCFVIPMLFQQCTDEIYEIDSVLNAQGDNITTELAADKNHPGIPLNAFLGRYYSGTQRSSLITERIEGELKQNSSDQSYACLVNEDVTAEWLGDIEFASGEYEFEINGDKGIKVFIDGEVTIDALTNKRQSSYKTFVTLDGVHRLLIFYNMDKSQIDDLIIEYYMALHRDPNAKPLSGEKKSVKDFMTSSREIVEIEPGQSRLNISWRKR